MILANRNITNISFHRNHHLSLIKKEPFSQNREKGSGYFRTVPPFNIAQKSYLSFHGRFQKLSASLIMVAATMLYVFDIGSEMMFVYSNYCHFSLS